MGQPPHHATSPPRQLEKLLERVCSHHPDAHLDLGIPFFQWFINPDDFGQSVENLFYTSFLVKDSKCSVDVDNETGELHISGWRARWWRHGTGQEADARISVVGSGVRAARAGRLQGWLDQAPGDHGVDRGGMEGGPCRGGA